MQDSDADAIYEQAIELKNSRTYRITEYQQLICLFKQAAMLYAMHNSRLKAALAFKQLGITYLSVKKYYYAVNPLNFSLIFNYDEDVLSLFIECGLKSKRFLQVAETIYKMSQIQEDLKLKYELLCQALKYFQMEIMNVNCLIDLTIVSLQLNDLESAQIYVVQVLDRCEAEFKGKFETILSMIQNQSSSSDILNAVQQ
ncbi:Hypothetical_protein [Hexamita inflata]|uniref:Hypothetical_protein n=1 Tax=Hexamita inflata TaxID=28002 RepID=A0AA86UJL0_9EUKA|nr:Hypothetical protein HINF_LOCUS48435 [Hexamita inflata]